MKYNIGNVGGVVIEDAVVSTQHFPMTPDWIHSIYRSIIMNYIMNLIV